MIRQNFFRCGILGWTMEVLWTGLHAFRIRNPKLTGFSSLWMFPIYGSAAFLTPVMNRMKGQTIWKRGLVYMLLIFTGEYFSGSFLKRLHACPWDYSRSPFHYRGVIRLDYAPLWFLVGLFYEKILLKSEKTS